MATLKIKCPNCDEMIRIDNHLDEKTFQCDYCMAVLQLRKKFTKEIKIYDVDVAISELLQEAGIDPPC